MRRNFGQRDLGRLDDESGRALPILAWMLRRYVQRQLRQADIGRLIVTLPDGARIDHRGTQPGPEATLAVNRWSTFARVVTGGSNGFAEAFMDGTWSSPDLPKLLEWFDRNGAALETATDGPLLVRVGDRLRHALRSNTRRNSRRNIAAHYDLGNAFYAAWLDDSMSYSSGIYADAHTSLEEAQTAKIARVCDLLEVRPGQRVLEIGAGWGGVMEAVARQGAAITGLTLSVEQKAFAEARLTRTAPGAGWDVRMQDYRDVGDSFDRVVSIEMLEAVGEAYWPVYFKQVHDRLRPGGVAVIQVISIAADRYEGYRRRPDFIQRYIFPGGMLPTPAIVADQARAAGLDLTRREDFGLSYADTLRDWRVRFLAAWPRIAPLGFDPRFKRMWEYYLAYCEAGFRDGAIDVHLFQFRKPPADGTA
jgi:cyclopropane-fatty-acyl-phospholipid synthase